MSQSEKIAFQGQIVLIGFGSVGRGVYELLLKHFAVIPKQLTIIDPLLEKTKGLIHNESNCLALKITSDNYVSLLDSILPPSGNPDLIINLATEVASVDLIRYAKEHNAFYIDTVVEPWPGTYLNETLTLSEQTNYALREELLKLKAEFGPHTKTAVSCCGANPGMVSWLVKEALLNLASDLGLELTKLPNTSNEWASLANQLEIKGVHIAERDTQYSPLVKSLDTFTNTWSVEGMMAEALQPAELGWGTHEKELPSDGYEHTTGNRSAIYLESKGAETLVHTWVPSSGPIRGFLVTHNEAISISDYFTLRDQNDHVIYRPTCHYAYHPTEATVEALLKLADNDSDYFSHHHIYPPEEISSGYDELGVLLYGHKKNAYWYGSKLSNAEAQSLVKSQNATGLQVSSAVLAGIMWLLSNPNRGIVEAEEMDHQFCLAIQKPYLGEIFGAYTDWQPASEHHVDPWQFSNLRVKQK